MNVGKSCPEKLWSWREVILPLWSVLVRPHLEVLHLDVESSVQEGCEPLGVECLPYEDRLRDLGQFSLEKR